MIMGDIIFGTAMRADARHFPVAVAVDDVVG